MKRTILLLAAVLTLSSCLIFTVSADTHDHSNGYVTLTLDVLTAAPGETVTVSVSIEKCTVSSMGFIPSYDKSALKLTGGEWTIQGELSDGWDSETNFPVIAFDKPTEIEGKIFEFTLEVLGDAKNGEAASVSLETVAIKNGNTDIHAHVAPGEINVEGEPVKKNGCGSSLSATSVLLCAIGAAAVMAGKKD